MDAEYDPVAGFARAAQAMAETQQILAQTNHRIEDTQRRMADTHRLALRLQGFALALLGLALLGTGALVWQHLTQRTDHAALLQALRTETQTLDAHTQALREMLRRAPER